MKNNLEELVSRELSRKEFLKFAGGAIVVLFGLSNFISYLSRFKQTGALTVTQETQHGFGSRKFGK